MLFQNHAPNLPFSNWLKTDKENSRLLLGAGFVLVIQFVLFKILYPYPNFMPPDSNNYLKAAVNNDFVNIWPIGYSKFLRLISSISKSHMVLTSLQYLMLQGSLLYFLFTVKFWMQPAKWLFRILLFASLLSPLIVHISNFVSSDALFTALSLIWFSQLIWISNRPTRSLLISHSFILLFSFMVRYNSLYYPLLSITCIMLTKTPTINKAIGGGLTILLLGWFIGRTEFEYYKTTGTKQFSAFGGWQIAANALYGYAHSFNDPLETVPKEFRQLHSLVNNHMDSIRHLKVRPDNEVFVYYLWDFKSPLKVYLNDVQKKRSNETYFKQWAYVAPLYSKYGRHLISNHPTAFIKYFVWPNLIKYYAPPVKFMGLYNMGNDKVEKVIVDWFGWKNNKLPLNLRDRDIKITSFFSPLTGIINVIFILSFVSVYFLGLFQSASNFQKRILYWALATWLFNMSFSVLAAPIELRYQIFSIVITSTFSCLLISYLYEMSRLRKPKSEVTENKKDLVSQTIIQLP